MSNVLSKTRKARVRGAGFTLVEAAISIVLVSVLLVAALNTVAAAKLGQQQTAERGQAHLLAQELMSEIMRQDYADPEDVGRIDLRDPMLSTAAMGADSGESNSNRLDFDDVDDYDGWNASPPQNKDGPLIPNLAGWRRIVTVERRSLADSKQPTGTEEGLKHITVQVERDGALIAQLEALKGAGLPPLPPEPSVLFVVTDDVAPSSDELARQALMESWGFTVSLIAAAALQADFDNAVVNANVAYVSETILSSDLGTKLVAAPIGVVNEEGQLIDDFGFASGTPFAYSTTNATVLDNTHYITSPFATGLISVTTSSQPHIYADVGLGDDVQVLGTISSGKASLLTVNAGGTLAGGGAAPARRVKMFWGNTGFDFTTLTPDGQTIMKRAIEWAAGMEKP
ncbi:MAG: hypothetical protein IH987_07750 [Planctomycetes bacterium]|nr:hypothetical protein [Planctomycetota bacterium]